MEHDDIAMIAQLDALQYMQMLGSSLAEEVAEPVKVAHLNGAIKGAIAWMERTGLTLDQHPSYQKLMAS